MTRKRKPRTRLQSRYRQQMRKCRLYRWQSQADGDQEDFKIFGPYGENKNFSLMEHAVTTRRKWFLVITSYFVTPQGDYYEEMLTFPPFGPMVFNDTPEQILATIDQAVPMAIESGNPEDYRDTCIALYLHTEALERGFESDEFTKKRAAHRASVLESLAPPGAK